jgi:hypothetical protein
MRPVIRGRSLAAVIVLSLALLAPGGALADTPVSHSGVRGIHGLPDTREQPNVRCTYDPDEEALQVRVLAPVVYAVDRGAGVQSQRVGWRFRVQYSSGLGYSTWKTTTTITATATDRRPAGFELRSKSFAKAPPVSYRVRVDMYWYDSAGRVTGRATHAPTWYRSVAEGESDVVEGSC